MLFAGIGILLHAQGYQVKKYSTDVYVSEKGYLDIVERYEVEFSMQSHGIFREIVTQFDYENPQGEIEKRRIYISKIKTPGEKHKSNPSVSLQDFYDKLQIRIGDMGRYVNGKNSYEIQYRVKNALFQKDSIVQLYWNIKPAHWDAPFEEIHFTIHVPKGIEVNSENTFVYTGMGNAEISQDFSYTYDTRSFTAQSRNNFQSHSGESVTVLLKMPDAAFSAVGYSPSLFKRYGWLLFTLVPTFYLLHLRNKYGKNNKVAAITSYYPPDGIDAAMAGYLIDNQADANDLISLLPKWGSEGLIRIRETSKKGWFGKADIEIIKLKNIGVGAPSYEKTIFQGLFSRSWEATAQNAFNTMKDILKSHSEKEFTARQNQEYTIVEITKSTVLISDLKDNFYEAMKKGKRELRQKAKAYYDPDITKKRNKIGLWSLLWLVLGSVLLGFIFGVIAGIANSIIFAATLLFIFKKMKKRTPVGDRIFGELKGFKNFIKIAETNRIKMLVEEDPDYFEKTMSYALSFGQLKQWAKKFAALNIEPPQWYVARTEAMRMEHFADSFSSKMSTARSTTVSSSKSNSTSGGGSAGGGVGSGGGGRWSRV